MGSARLPLKVSLQLAEQKGIQGMLCLLHTQQGYSTSII
jgi:hypothetical protein